MLTSCLLPHRCTADVRAKTVGLIGGIFFFFFHFFLIEIGFRKILGSYFES